jgi:hypothetical protein
VAAIERWNSWQNEGVIKQPEPFPEPPKPQNPTQRAEADGRQPATRREGFFCGESPPATTAGQLDGKTTDQDWRNAPATEKQKEKLRAFGCKFDEGITATKFRYSAELHGSTKAALPFSKTHEAIFPNRNTASVAEMVDDA